jgi:hypothetical protein
MPGQSSKIVSFFMMMVMMMMLVVLGGGLVRTAQLVLQALLQLLYCW